MATDIITKILYAETNAVCIIMLIIIIMNKAFSANTTDSKLFRWLSGLTACVLFFDSLTWIFNGSVFPGSRYLHLFGLIVYYLLQPSAAFMWLVFVDSKVNEGRGRAWLRIMLYLIPLLANTVLTGTNAFTGIYFTVDVASNVYTRAPTFWISMALTYIYAVIALIMLVCKSCGSKSGVNKREYMYYILFIVPPSIGAIIQALFFGVSLIWVATSISILFLFVYTQNYQISTDSLTGLFNRRQLYRYITEKASSLGTENDLYAILLDIDGFKSINDTFGHATGDAALIELSDILKTACARQMDFSARMGGDEFALICCRKKGMSIDSLIARINLDIDDFNNNSSAVYRLSISLGCAKFGTENTLTVDTLMSEADKKMYENKYSKRIGQ